MLFGHMIGPKNLESVSEVDHLRHGRRLLQRVVAERKSNASHLVVKGDIRVRSAARDDLRFALRCGVLHPDVKAAPANRSPRRRSSLLVSTTNGTLLAATVPNSGESCQAERISRSMASKPSSTLSNSSIRRTQGRSHSRARINGPGRKKSRPFKLACRSCQLSCWPFEIPCRAAADPRQSVRSPCLR